MGPFERLGRPLLFGAALVIGGYLLLPSPIIVPMALTKGADDPVSARMDFDPRLHRLL